MTRTHYDAIEIRHEPDGKLMALFVNPDNEDIVEYVEKAIKGSNNFSVRGIHGDFSHSSFKNEVLIYRDLKKTIEDDRKIKSSISKSVMKSTGKI